MDRDTVLIIIRIPRKGSSRRLKIAFYLLNIFLVTVSYINRYIDLRGTCSLPMSRMGNKTSDHIITYWYHVILIKVNITASLHAHSLAASRVEQALSEVASSVSSMTPRPGPQRAWLLQLQVWLLLAEIYLALDQVPAAAASIQEATTIFPLSHHIMYTVNIAINHSIVFKI